MRTSRQDYKDADLETALKLNCDVLQLKLDGWWARVEIINGFGQVFSETGRHLPRFDFQCQSPFDATVIGELMHGTQWSKDPSRYGKIYLFDCWKHGSLDLEALPYKERYIVTKSLLASLPSNFDLVQNFRLSDWKVVWPEYVATGKYEGVVYRNSRAPTGLPVLREKFLFTDDLKVVGAKEGLGKHEGRLGALLCISSDGVPTDVGGGFDDDTRREVWQNLDSYIGRYCQVEARKRFESGSLRHPNFLAWRPEGWAP